MLSLSLRNPLLNYRPRARSLEVVGESPEQVVRCLVREGRRMAFLPAADSIPQATDQADSRLQTALTAEALKDRLLAIHYAARASVEEQGVNTLFLAVGMLRWVDPGHGPGVLLAPLVLVPVELERKSARERFRLRHSGGDIETNLSLFEKLRADFGISLPDPPEPAEGDVSRYLDGVAGAVAGREGWSVDGTAVVLGFFSFGKFLMYRDLDPEVWPEHARPVNHRVIQSLLRDGYLADPENQASEPDLDRVAPPERAMHVVDADATQALAIWDVGRGRDLVIQGPPGTGKSQTITNLIAAAVGAGKSVLFVAEKLAALEVVKRRLDAAGLGDACLELHSHKTSKRAVLDELERTYALGRPRAPADDDDRAMLAETRERLNAYAAAVHGPVGASGVSPFQAVGAILKPRGGSDGSSPVTPDLSAAPGWTPIERKRRLALVAELQASLAATGVPRDHPFRGARRTTWPPTETERLRERVDAAAKATERLVKASAALARFLRVPEPVDRDGCAALLRVARAAGRSGPAQGVDVSGHEWVARKADLHELIAAGRTLAALHARYDEALMPAAWRENLDEARQTLNLDRRHWWRRLSGAFRAAERKVKGLCRGTPPEDPDALIALADAVLDAQRSRETIRQFEPLAARLFGARWQGERSNWDALASVADSARRLHHEVHAGKLPAGLLGFLADRPSLAPLRPAVEDLKAALAVHHDAVNAVSVLLDFQSSDDEGPLPSRPLAAQADLFRVWCRRAGDLPALVAFNRLAGRCRGEGLSSVVDLAEVWPEAVHGLAEAVERRFDEAVIRQAFDGRPALAGFDAVGHEQAVRTFARLDRLTLGHNRARAALAHWERLPRREGGGQLGVLRREFEKKARHLPVRQLLGKAGRAVQAIKPVFLMSPMSVAAYLAPGGLEFDLVVFDEASQVRPVEALGAILRGKQTVVVGDSRQLPPTTFFDRLTGSNDDDPDDDPDAGDSSEIESILGLFVTAGAPERMLRWHYRSRHESLIAVSNREFYGGKLAVFPSPDAARRDAGLVLRHLPGTAYDRGGTRTNPDEAEAVAKTVLDHAREQLTKPAGERLTLGVAAFSAAQAQAILQWLERLREDDSEAEPFFDPNGPEPFFVKNLENVQGDERDVIFISVGYGRTADGDISMSFGPLNGDGGERRLNVLITRARVRCEVFTNLTADDIDLSRTRSRGVRALKTFLAYAETGRLGPSSGRGRVARRRVNVAHVLAAAEAAGLSARGDVGASGLAPDLAVTDPERPEDDVLGVLTDGPPGQPARPARDRERLRPQVLESLGWRLHRVWSTDWARDPAGALRRLREAVNGAREATNGTPEVPAGPLARDEPGDDVAKPTAAEAYRLAVGNGGLDLATADTAAIAARLAEVVRVEGPIHRDEADRRVAEGAGAKRVGPRAREALDEALGLAVAEGSIVSRGDFLWPVGLERPAVRDRAALPAASRRLELVAPEELEMAAEAVVSDALGMPRDAVPAATCRLLGFPRMSDDMRARVEAAVARLVEGRRLVVRGDHLVAEPKDGPP